MSAHAHTHTNELIYCSSVLNQFSIFFSERWSSAVFTYKWGFVKFHPFMLVFRVLQYLCSLVEILWVYHPWYVYKSLSYCLHSISRTLSSVPPTLPLFSALQGKDLCSSCTNWGCLPTDTSWISSTVVLCSRLWLQKKEAPLTRRKSYPRVKNTVRRYNDLGRW